MKKAISILLCLCLALSVFTVVPFAASAAEVTEESVGATSGTTVDCTWALDDNDTLTISGYGAMGDYSSQKLNGTWITTAPWGANIKTVIIEDGVTYIGSYAFYGCTGLTSVTIPDSVTSIGSNSFYGCTGLTSITIPDSLANIEGDAFNNRAWYNNQPDGMVYAGRVAYKYKGTMPDNTSIIIRDGTKGIAGSAFERCTGLTSVIIPDSVTSIGFGSLGYNWGRKKIDGLTIYGVPGSAAEQYANDNGFTFIEYVDAAIGDMTGDGKVNVRDVTAMQRHLAGLEELTDDRLALADVNTDGKVTIDDVTLLQRYLAEFDVTIG
ncbi:leucine-rich repeat protein [Lachnoclostridium sp. MSJ-17]|uniref:leucine-rich repeat protein n=1 Tax=Lachnoclostridium sp. MSJ-17 TaxID=2841516 RepID=UPI001C118952|nr:leucine-rich repeat protein [Lachnoclostridium sp. MSJ-17]MBU5461717.1 leucine-rich repeat protein [Lachnoclostridium sp. MSJ-17]